MPYSTKSTNTADLSTPVRYLRGIGPQRAAKLQRLGLETLEDVLKHPPRAWEDRRIGKGKVFLCQILNVKESIVSNGRITLFKAQVQVFKPSTPSRLTLSWIRRRSFKYDVFTKMRKELAVGAVILACGRLEEQGGGWPDLHVEDYMIAGLEALAPDYKWESSPHWLRLAPLYPATEGISQASLRQMRWDALQSAGNRLPSWQWSMLDKESALKDMISLDEAYRNIHFPSDERNIVDAKRSLASWELLLLSLAMEFRRSKTLGTEKPHRYRQGMPALFERLKRDLGFDLTEAQMKAIDEIWSNLEEPTPMNRLLQGEVGSGKTLVSLAAICKALESGHQAAFIAPTEILVYQHLLTFKKYLEPMGVRIAALTSDTKREERETILKAAALGEIQLLVGTHALLSQSVHFKSLALVIMDEQHRFGVKQRWVLRAKTRHPDCLVISATPIPRTLALALYGDLDITTMEGLPSGRQVAETLMADSENTAWSRIRERLDRGEQAYVVVPAIEEENAPYTLESETRRVAEIFKGFKAAGLHGRMPVAEKEKVMSDFAKGAVSILVATTVIEVGIDVPNASVIAILGAERFGLASLHQLRGRVGRGSAAGLCILVPSQNAFSGTEVLFSDGSALERLEQFSATRSGFEIGKLDLLTRGPGKLLGLEQHGSWDFEHFDFEHDADLIAPVRASAKQLAGRDPALKSQPLLRSELQKRYREHLMSDLS